MPLSTELQVYLDDQGLTPYDVGVLQDPKPEARLEEPEKVAEVLALVPGELQEDADRLHESLSITFEAYRVAAERLRALMPEDRSAEALRAAAERVAPPDAATGVDALKRRISEVIAAMPNEDELGDLTPDEFESVVKLLSDSDDVLPRLREGERGAYIFSTPEGFVERWSEKLPVPVLGEVIVAGMFYHYGVVELMNKRILQFKAAQGFQAKLSPIVDQITQLPEGSKTEPLEWFISQSFSLNVIVGLSSRRAIETLVTGGKLSQGEIDFVRSRILERGERTDDDRIKLIAANLLSHLHGGQSTQVLLRATKFVMKTIEEFDQEWDQKEESINSAYTGYEIKGINFSKLLVTLKGRHQRDAIKFLKDCALRNCEKSKRMTILQKIYGVMDALPENWQSDIALAILRKRIERAKAEQDAIYIGLVVELIRYVPEKSKVSLISELLPFIVVNSSERLYHLAQELFHNFSDLKRIFDLLGHKARRRALLRYLDIRGDIYLEHQHFRTLGDALDVFPEDSYEQKIDNLFYEFYRDTMWGEGGRGHVLNELRQTVYLDSRFVLSLMDTKTFSIIPEDLRRPIREGISSSLRGGGSSQGLSRDALRGIVTHLAHLLEEAVWEDFLRAIGESDYLSRLVSKRSGRRAILSEKGPAQTFNRLMNSYVAQAVDPVFAEEYGKVLSQLYSFNLLLLEKFAQNVLEGGVVVPLSDLPNHLNNFLRDNLVSVLGLTDEESERVHASLGAHEQAWLNGDLLPNLLSAAHYTNERGRRFIKKLVLDLTVSPVDDDEFVYEGKRFDYLMDLGVPEDVVALWKQERMEVVFEGAREVSKGAARPDRQIIYKTALDQLVDHLNLQDIDLSNEGELRNYLFTTYGEQIFEAHWQGYHDLLNRLVSLITALRSGDFISRSDLGSINQFFTALGSRSFAGLPSAIQEVSVDVKTLEESLYIFAKAASKEEVKITSRVQHMLSKGEKPILSCQRISERTAQNVNGEPVAMLFLGQFKLAQYLFDGKVAARSLLELVPRDDGLHLVVERLYPGAGFTQEHVKRFETEILNYATQLKIPEERVHVQFTGRNMNTLPDSFNFGLPIYRDTTKEDPRARKLDVFYNDIEMVFGAAFPNIVGRAGDYKDVVVDGLDLDALAGEDDDDLDGVDDDEPSPELPFRNRPEDGFLGRFDAAKLLEDGMDPADVWRLQGEAFDRIHGRHRVTHKPSLRVKRSNPDASTGSLRYARDDSLGLGQVFARLFLTGESDLRDELRAMEQELTAKQRRELMRASGATLVATAEKIVSELSSEPALSEVEGSSSHTTKAGHVLGTSGTQVPIRPVMPVPGK